MKLVLPLPPSINHYYVTNRYTSARIMGKEAREWFEQVGWTTKRPEAPYGDVVSVYAMIYCDNRRDLDNFLKPLGDVLQHTGIIANDKQITFWQVQKIVSPKKEWRVELEIPELA